MANLTRFFRSRQFAGALNIAARNLTSNVAKNTAPVPIIKLSSLNLVDNPWIWRQHEKIKSPILNKIEIDLPNNLKWVPPILEEPSKKIEIEMPPEDSDKTIEAARLIVIRRKKMKRHKLKKLRKRMKYEWAKIRQRRELKKEKAFQAVLIKQCKEGEAFSAEDYVRDRLEKYNQILNAVTAKSPKNHLR